MKSFLQSDFMSSIGFTSITSSHLSSRKSQSTIKNFFQSPFIPLFFIFLIVIAISFASFHYVQSKTPIVAGAKTKQNPPVILQQLDRSFTFFDSGSNLNKTDTFVYTLQHTEIRSQIFINNHKEILSDEKVFLVLTLKIINNTNHAMDVNAKDYVRVLINNAPDKFAADIHQDPVVIQPISTKYTKLVFTLDKTDKDIVLQVGEIDSEKETIALNIP